MADSERPVGYRFGSFVLDLEWGGLLAEGGKEMPLRPKSFALLCLLVENSGRIISHEAIMEMLWPDVFVTENNVTQCIHEIRRALGSEALETLQTLPRRGYRFTSNVGAIPPGCPRIRESGVHQHDDRHSMPASSTSETKSDRPRRHFSTVSDSNNHKITRLPPSFSDMPPRNDNIREDRQYSMANAGKNISLL
jgi:DNA-binding winged helix-turn-helix (wHTH) protein